MSQLHLFRSVGLTNKRRKKEPTTAPVMLFALTSNHNVDVNIKELIEGVEFIDQIMRFNFS
jgi:hypothetical protein